MNRNILITIKKELRSMFRDKKTILTMLLFPLIIPVLIFIYGYMYDDIDSGENDYNVIVNYQVTDGEKTIMDSLNIEYVYEENIEKIEDMYKNDSKYDGYILYTEDNNTYTIYADTSTTDGLTFEAMMTSYLESYSQYLTDNYLTSLGVDLNIAYNHFNVESKDLATNNYMLTLVLSVSFTYIVMAICMASSNMAIATTALEKENGTLETILTFPIKKTELIIGKYLSSVILSFISSFIGLVLTIFGILAGKHCFEYFKAFKFNISFGSIGVALAVIVLGSLFISGCALALTSKSKSFKEAQSQVGLLNTICIIPLFVSILSIELNSYYYLIPICNFEQLLMDAFTGSINLINLGMAALSTIIFIVLVVSYIIKAYNSEDILFKN